ncbi:MAG: alpha/beta hydrolase [Cyanobacteria bacterium P01_H01_bin.15]
MIVKAFKKLQTRGRWLVGLISAIAAFGVGQATLHAQEITFFYSLLSLSMPVESLETFAETGEIDTSLNDFARLINPTDEQLEKFQTGLTASANVDPVLLSRLLNTDEGERLLEILGSNFTVLGGRNAQIPLRGALVSAAFEPEGLSSLSFLRNLPVNMQIDVEQSLKRARQVEYIVDATKTFSDKMFALAATEADTLADPNYGALPNLAEPGPLATTHTTWNLVDTNRDDRKFYVEVHTPATLPTGELPVIVISHGLNSRPEDFADVAEHLASNGFVVVMPQHPGSDTAQGDALLKGTSRVLFRLDEFINRPADISFTLDELERRNQAEFGGRLNLERVGALGHSFGGYTVLAIAGAKIDFEHLQQDCDDKVGQLNTALYLQCRALKLERQDSDFRDERVTSVIAYNPVNASIFGPKGLSNVEIPVLIGAGSYDPAAPFVFEQLRSFPWISSPERYLLLREGQTHVDISKLDAGISDAVRSVPNLTLPSPQLLKNYSSPVVIAFAKVYTAQDNDYGVYLEPDYLNYLSEGQEFKAALITEKSSDELQAAIDDYIRANRSRVE